MMSQSPRNFSRRDLFRGLVARGKAAYHEVDDQPKRTVPRPPGALAEAQFRQLCDGCGLCVEACPSSVIQLTGQWPELCLDYNHCQLCTQCAQVCPTGALLPATKTELLPTFAYQCHNRLLGYCELCIEQCPTQAIHCEPNQQPVVNEDLCNGCGECRPICPANAIEWQFRKSTEN